MNIIQIARIMGDSLTFGDLPESLRIVDGINSILESCDSDEAMITTTSTGSDLVEVYDDMRPAVQNKLAALFEEDYKLREAITSDIVLWEASERRREAKAHQQTVRLSFITVAVIVGAALYQGYAYHKYAEAILGVHYESPFLDTLDTAYDLVTDGIPNVSKDEPETPPPVNIEPDMNSADP